MERSELQTGPVIRNVIRVPERGSVELASSEWDTLNTSEEFWGLRDRGVFQIETLKSGRVRLRGSCYVGRALCGSTILEVAEKVPGATGALLGYSTHRAFRIERVRSIATGLGDLLGLLASQFLSLVAIYVSNGRKFEYTSQQQIGALAGGRIRMVDTLRLRSRGLVHLLAFDRNVVTHSIDINRVLLVALSEFEILARLVPVPPETLAQSRQLSLLFQDCRDAEVLFRSRSYFVDLAEQLITSTAGTSTKDMLSLASAVIGHMSFEHGREMRGSAPRTWFLNLETLFESAVRQSLTELLNGTTVVWRGTAAPARIFENENEEYTANPDIVLGPLGSVGAIADAKYKYFNGSGGASDVYQLLTHAEAFQSKVAFLVYPGTSFSSRMLGPSNGQTIVWFFSVRVESLSLDLEHACHLLGLL